MKRFAFLQCGHCRHFQSKRDVPHGVKEWGGAFHTGAIVGRCLVDEEPQWLVWKSLEHAASYAGMCFEREEADDSRPRCEFYDFTTESGAQTYPKDCVYYGRPNCPMVNPNASNSSPESPHSSL